MFLVGVSAQKSVGAASIRKELKETAFSFTKTQKLKKAIHSKMMKILKSMRKVYF